VKNAHKGKYREKSRNISRESVLREEKPHTRGGGKNALEKRKTKEKKGEKSLGNGANLKGKVSGEQKQKTANINWEQKKRRVEAKHVHFRYKGRATGK